MYFFQDLLLSNVSYLDFKAQWLAVISIVFYFAYLYIYFRDVIVHGCTCVMQSIEEENKKGGDHMVNIVRTLTSVFENSIHAAFPDISVAVAVAPAAQEKFGDYQCNSAMNIAQVHIVGFALL